MFIMLFLFFFYLQSLVHPETWWPKTSLTPVLLCLGPRPPVMFVSIGSSGRLGSLKRPEKRQYKETPQPQFWRVSPQRHVIRSLCLLVMAVERVSHWLERKPRMVSYLTYFNSSTIHLFLILHFSPLFIFYICAHLSFSWCFSNAFLLSYFPVVSFWMSHLGVT